MSTRTDVFCDFCNPDQNSEGRGKVSDSTVAVAVRFFDWIRHGKLVMCTECQDDVASGKLTPEKIATVMEGER